MSEWGTWFDLVVREVSGMLEAIRAGLHAYPGTAVVILTLLMMWMLTRFP